MDQVASVLYYPHMEIRENWLKAALLLWDCVYRIVPSTYRPADASAVRVAADSGLVRPVVLESEDFSAISGEFRSFLHDLPWLPAGLDGSRTDRLHKGKIDAQLYPALEKLATRVDPEGFLELPSDLGRGYMMYLAKAVSGRRNLATITDDRYAWTISPYFREPASFGDRVYDPSALAMHCSLVFQDLVPESLADVDMRQIVRFVHTRADERSNLRRAIQQFAKEIVECQSSSHAAELRVLHAARIEDAKADFRRSMGFCSQEVSHALLTLGIPIAATVFSALATLEHPFALCKVSGSILLGAVAAYSKQKNVKAKRRRESDVSYLVDVDQELIQRRAVPDYGRIFEEFIND